MWLWERSKGAGEKDAFRIIYQGQVKPGGKIGEIIQRGEKRRPKKKKK
jgi:hypothetical protein